MSNTKKLTEIFESKPCVNNFDPKGLQLPEDIFTCFGKLKENPFIAITDNLSTSNKKNYEKQSCHCTINYEEMRNIKTASDLSAFVKASATAYIKASIHDIIVVHLKFLWLFHNNFEPIGKYSFKIKYRSQSHFKNELNTMYKNKLPHYEEMKELYNSVYFTAFIPTTN